MKVLTKDQAQAWLNQPEQEGITLMVCIGSSELAMLAFQNGYTTRAWFAVDFDSSIYRKKPWHWPKPDADTPVDAKVWSKSAYGTWHRAHYAGGLDTIFSGGHSSWTADDNTWSSKQMVLANPDDLDEVPPMDLEV